jgi:Zn-dependent peptidase ImmA (M78 family)/transcriptional regulator with XRE-family HTH domain
MAVDRDILAQELRAARENRGISQQVAAKRTGLSRTVIAQIELANRPVSTDELAKLAAVYGRAVVDLLGQPAGEDDVLLMLVDLAPELAESKFESNVGQFLALCREAMALESALGWSPRGSLPHYNVAAPRSTADAIEQGERIATEERQRVGFGAILPASKLSASISWQGVRTFAVDLPENVTGLAVQHRSIRPAILVNRRQGVLARRFALAHEYGHVLLDRKVGVTKRENSDELIEKRADAFAGAFLLPALGLEQALSALNKGLPSRKTHIVFSIAVADAARAEVRPVPGSQTVTYQDVATIVRRFGLPYRAVATRLLALGMISDADAKDVLSDKHVAAARQHESLFGSEPERSSSRNTSSVEPEATLDLLAEVVHLAIEACRRQVIKKDRVRSVAKLLNLGELPEAKLLEFVEAAR